MFKNVSYINIKCLMNEKEKKNEISKKIVRSKEFFKIHQNLEKIFV